MTKISSNNHQNVYSTTPKTKKHKILKTASKLAVATAVVAGSYYVGKKTGTFDILKNKVINNEKFQSTLKAIKTFLLGVGIGQTTVEIADVIKGDSQKNIKEDVKSGVKEALKETLQEADGAESSKNDEIEQDVEHEAENVSLPHDENIQTEPKAIEPEILLLPEGTNVVEIEEENPKDEFDFSFDVPKASNAKNENNKDEISIQFPPMYDSDDNPADLVHQYDKINRMDAYGFGHIDTKDFPIDFEDLIFVGNRAMDENLNIVSGEVPDKRYENAHYFYEDGMLKKYTRQIGDELLISKFSYDDKNRMSKIEVSTCTPNVSAQDDPEWVIKSREKMLKEVTFDRENGTMKIKKYYPADEYVFGLEEAHTYDKNGKLIRLDESHLGKIYRSTLYDQKKVITYEGIPPRRVVSDLEEEKY